VLTARLLTRTVVQLPAAFWAAAPRGRGTRLLGAHVELRQHVADLVQRVLFKRWRELRKANGVLSRVSTGARAPAAVSTGDATTHLQVAALDVHADLATGSGADGPLGHDSARAHGSLVSGARAGRHGHRGARDERRAARRRRRGGAGRAGGAARRAARRRGGKLQGSGKAERHTGGNGSRGWTAGRDEHSRPQACKR